MGMNVSRLFTVLLLMVTGVLVGTAGPASATRTLMTVKFGTQYPDLGITYFTSEGADEVSVEIPTGDNSRIVFHDPNASSMTIDNEAGLSGTLCTLDATTPPTISCPKSAMQGVDRRKVETVSIITWDGDDVLSSSGFGTIYGTGNYITPHLGAWEGNDTLTISGAPGFANAQVGNDTINVGSNGVGGDHASCMGGTDTVTKNSGDFIDTANCETINTV